MLGWRKPVPCLSERRPAEAIVARVEEGASLLMYRCSCNAADIRDTYEHRCVACSTRTSRRKSRGLNLGSAPKHFCSSSLINSGRDCMLAEVNSSNTYSSSSGPFPPETAYSRYLFDIFDVLISKFLSVVFPTIGSEWIREKEVWQRGREQFQLRRRQELPGNRYLGGPTLRREARIAMGISIWTSTTRT